jgi:DNA-binding transcriptional ArsR family regulator
MKHSEVLQILADPTRITLIELLLQRSYCVSALAGVIGISAPAVSQHLKVCQQAGLVQSEKIGYHTHYRVNRDMLRNVSAAVTRLADTETLPCEMHGTRCSSHNGRCGRKMKLPDMNLSDK